MESRETKAERVGAYEAKTHLAELLERVKNGEAIVITKHGVPVAELRPVSGNDEPDFDKLFEEMVAFRENRRFGEPLLEAIHNGRRR